MRQEDGDAPAYPPTRPRAKTAGAPPCPDGFCDDPEVRALVRQICEANIWPAGQKVMVQKADGTWCSCYCGSPCEAEYCQRPDVQAAVQQACAMLGLPPGAHVEVMGPDGGRCYCTCGQPDQRGEAEPADGAAPPDAPAPSPESAP